MKNFIEFREAWINIRQYRARKETSNLLFVVVYPDKLKWNFSIEKQTQTTTMAVSGGRTGAGTGHNIEFVHQKKLYEYLKPKLWLKIIYSEIEEFIDEVFPKK